VVPMLGYEALSLRQPPARLLAMICLSIVFRAAALIFSPSCTEIILAVLLVCRPVTTPERPPRARARS
jgi:hypothetical protein